MLKVFSPGLFIYNSSADNSIVIKTEDYEATSSDNTILAEAATESVTISLDPDPSDGQKVTIKCIDSTFACIIARNGKLIDGSAINLNLALNVSRTLEYATDHGWVITG